MAAAPAPPTRDIGQPDLSWGSWGQGLLTEWWETSADLIWPQSVITYGKMRHDPQLRGVLSAFILPILRARWAVDGEGCRPQVTKHVADDFGLPVIGALDEIGPARRRGLIWHRHLRQVFQKLVFGHMPFERRYELDDTAGLYHLVSLGPRMPWTIANLHLQDGQITEMQQTTQQEPLPAGRLVWYGNEIEGAAWTGMSVLRAAFGAWLLKHETWRVHATSIRRFGMGVPSVTAPPGATAAQVTEAQALASGMRAGDQSGAGLPAGFKFELAGLTGSVPDALAFIKYLDQQMSKMALAGIIDLGQTEIGSRALGESFLDLFMLALQGLADDIATETTTGYPNMPGAVLDLVNVNWGEGEPCPRIVCLDVGEQHQVTAQAMMWLLQYGAITADPELERFIRQAWRIPQRTTPQPPVQPSGHPSSAVPGPAAPPGPPAPGGPPAPAPAPAAAGRGRRARAAALADLRRQLTPQEVRAGFDPIAIQADWQDTRDWLLAQWTPIFRAQRDSLVDQVATQVDKGRPDKLAALTVDTTAGAALLKDAMVTLAGKAADQMRAEAEHQGVTVAPAKVKISAARLGKAAQARAAMAGAYVAAQAGQGALQVVQASAGTDAADWVGVLLDGLSQVSLRDQVGAALTAAQNLGRLAVLEVAPAAEYVSTEVLDASTCDPCAAEDGTVYPTLAEADAAYPNGGFAGCAGFMRCRGTMVALWGGG